MDDQKVEAAVAIHRFSLSETEPLKPFEFEVLRKLDLISLERVCVGGRSSVLIISLLIDSHFWVMHYSWHQYMVLLTFVTAGFILCKSANCFCRHYMRLLFIT